MRDPEKQTSSQLFLSKEGNTFLVKGSISMLDRRPAEEEEQDTTCSERGPKFKTKKWLTRWAEETNSTQPSSPHSDPLSSNGGDPESSSMDSDDDHEKRISTKRRRADARARDIVETEEDSSGSEMPLDDDEFIPSSSRITRSREFKKRRTSIDTSNTGVSAAPVEDSVKKVLAKTGVSPESIVRLINNTEDKSEVIKQTGFSKNYIMKLQRKVLRSSKQLQLKEASVHVIGNTPIHVLFDCDNQPLFIKKELCQLLDMKGTTFSYWKKKASVQEIDTSQSFRLMDQCRTIFGGRSTYTMYKAQDTLKILTAMETSRQRNFFSNLPHLKQLAIHFLSEMDSVKIE